MTASKTLTIWQGWPLVRLPDGLPDTPAAQHKGQGNQTRWILEIPPPDPITEASFDDCDEEVPTDEEAALPGGAPKPDRRRAILRRFQDQIRVLRALADDYPDLVEGTGAPVLDFKQTRKVLEKACNGLDGASFRAAYNFLVRGLYRGNRKLGWDIQVPAPALQVKNTASVFVPDTYRALPAFHALRDAVLAAATDPAFYRPDDNPYLLRSLAAHSSRARRPWMSLHALHVGQILTASILFGAALNRAIVRAILEALPDGPQMDHELLWLSLQVELPPLGGHRKRAETGAIASADPFDQPIDNRVFRRYFPDPLTSLLVLRYHEIHPGPSPAPLRDIDGLVSFYLRGLQVDLEQLPRLGSLIQLARQGHATRMPASLMAYASTPAMARSLPEDAWIRIRHQLIVPTAPRDEDIEPTPSTHPPPRSRSAYSDQEVKMRAVRRTLDGLKKPRKAGQVHARDQLESLKNSGDLCPILYCLACWCEYLAAPRTTGGRDLRATSIQTYFSRIGPRLVSHGVDFNLETADEEDFLDLYDAVLEDAERTHTYLQIAKRLADFHRYLVSHFKVPTVSIYQGGHTMASVNACYITEREYLDAINALRTRVGTPPEIAQMQVILLMLGYRLGMRRGEAKYLRLRDVHILQTVSSNDEPGVLSAEVVLRSHAKRKLKSDNARRRLPAHVLMPPDEFDELVRFTVARQKQLGLNKDQLLVGKLRQPDEPLDENDGFVPVTAALRAATADPSMRFHALRHSFANRNLLMLWDEGASVILTSKWQPLVDHQRSSLRVRSRLRRCCFAFGFSGPSSKGLYALSTLVGHADPAVTLSSYVHVMDLILGAFLDFEPPYVAVNDQAVLLGIRPEPLRVARSKLGLRSTSLTDALTVIRSRAKRRFPECIPQGAAPRGPVTLPPAETPRDIPRWPDMMAVFQAVAAYSEQPNELDFDARCLAAARLVGRDGAQVRTWAAKAESLSALKARRGRPSLTRTGPEKGKDGVRDKPRRRYRQLLPAPPHSKAARIETRNYYDNLMAGLHDPGRAQRVRTAIRLFLYSVTSDASELYCKTLGAARGYSYLLKQAGVDSERIHLEISRVRFAQPEVQEQYWREHLALLQARVTDTNARDSRKPKIASTDDIETHRKKRKSWDFVHITDELDAAGNPLCPFGLTFRIVGARPPKRKTATPDSYRYSIASLRFAVILAAISADVMPEDGLPQRDSARLSKAMQRMLKGEAKTV